MHGRLQSGSGACAPRRSSGYLLVEVLVALAVSLLALTALIRLQGELIRNNAMARARSHAAILADDRMEGMYAMLRSDGATDVAAGSETLNSALRSGTTPAPAFYTRSWSVTPAPSAVTAIEVRLIWSDPGDTHAGLGLVSQIDPAAITYGVAPVMKRDFVLLP